MLICIFIFFPVHGMPEEVMGTSQQGTAQNGTPKAEKSNSTKTVSLAFGIISMILLLIILIFIYKKLREKCAPSTVPDKGGVVHAPGSGDVVQFVNDLVSGKKVENEPHLDRTATTTTTAPDSDPSTRKKMPPPRPHLPYAAVKISSLEPQKAEVAKWDD